MPNNLPAKEFEQLQTAIKWSLGQLETPRENRVDAIKEFVGKHYADDGSTKVVPTNFIELAVTIYARQLAARAPRCLITARSPKLRAPAHEFQLALNQVPEEVGLGHTLRKSVVEALFSLAVVKVGIHATRSVLGHEYGEPFVDLITMDDYFVDMSARDYKEIQFEGNDYWMSLEDAQKAFPVLEKAEGDDHTVQGSQGETRAEEVTQDEGADLYKEKIWLRDVWLPDKNVIVTYAVKTGKQLNVAEWDGPEGGPYERLSFQDVPGNLLPLPPVSLWRDLHELANTLFRKMSKQATGYKSVLGFASGDEKDAERFKSARDGDGIEFNGKQPQELTAGGVDQTSLAFYLQSRDLFSYFAGNLDALGGLAPQADTLGQDRLMSEAASTRLKDMADSVHNFSKRIFKRLAWYEWTDPVRQRHLSKEIKGTGVVVPVTWTLETREGEFLDYNFDIDVYSMQDDSPSSKMQKLGMVMTQYVLPLQPVLEASGMTIDFEYFFELVGQYSNLPELKSLLKFALEGQGQGQEPRGNPNPRAAGGKPANTTRTYERVNRPGASRSGKDQVMSQLLMGGGNKDEKASLFRSNS